MADLRQTSGGGPSGQKACLPSTGFIVSTRVSLYHVTV